MSLITISAGNDIDLVYTLSDQNGDVVDLTGGSISWKMTKTGATSTEYVTKTGALTDPTNGVTTVSISASDTTSYKGTYEMMGIYTDSEANSYTFESNNIRLK